MIPSDWEMREFYRKANDTLRAENEALRAQAEELRTRLESAERAIGNALKALQDPVWEYLPRMREAIKILQGYASLGAAGEEQADG